MELISVRPLIESDYDEILVRWWRDWGWEPPVRDFLPDNGIGGLIVYHLDRPVCAGFMYMTNSKVSWVDWIISDKRFTDREVRKEAIKTLIEYLTDISKNVGNKYAYALIKHENLIKTYEGLGYIKGDSYTGEMIKVL